MPTVKESVCCQEIPEAEEKLRELDVQNTDWITDHEGFRSVCLDRWVLQTAASQMHQQMDLHTSLLSSYYFILCIWMVGF